MLNIKYIFITYKLFFIEKVMNSTIAPKTTKYARGDIIFCILNLLETKVSKGIKILAAEK